MRMGPRRGMSSRVAGARTKYKSCGTEPIVDVVSPASVGE